MPKVREGRGGVGYKICGGAASFLGNSFESLIKVFTEIYSRLSELKPKYALQNTQKGKGIPV